MRWPTRKRLIRLLYLKIVILLCIAALFAVSASKSHESAQKGWQPAHQVVPPELLAQIAQEHIQANTAVDPGQMKAWKIKSSVQSQALYLIDTRISHSEPSQRNPLCGMAGCLFLAYRSTTNHAFQQIFSAYLNPLLPANIPLIQPTTKMQAGFPCLAMNQLEVSRVRTYTLCFNGQTYETVDTQLQPQIYE